MLSLLCFGIVTLKKAGAVHTVDDEKYLLRK